MNYNCIAYELCWKVAKDFVLLNLGSWSSGPEVSQKRVLYLNICEASAWKRVIANYLEYKVSPFSYIFCPVNERCEKELCNVTSNYVRLNLFWYTRNSRLMSGRNFWNMYNFIQAADRNGNPGFSDIIANIWRLPWFDYSQKPSTCRKLENFGFSAIFHIPLAVLFRRSWQDPD